MGLWEWKWCLLAAALMNCTLFLLPLTWAESGAGLPLPPEELPVEEHTAPLPAGEVDSSYTVRVLRDGAVTGMTMAEYLQGVVRAEMPASFEQEALCAQAVAARTYTLYKMSTGGNHGETADI